MPSLSGDKDAEITEAFNATSRYLHNLLNIDSTYLDGMANHIYPSEIHLNKANSSDTEAPFLVSYLTISDVFVSSKLYYKCYYFDIVNFHS